MRFSTLTPHYYIQAAPYIVSHEQMMHWLATTDADVTYVGKPFNPLEARFLGTVGFRKDTQTYVSLTDPGDGHVFGTTRKSRWMRGAIVHVERKFSLLA